MEITKLKQRVKKLERRNKVKVLKLRRLQKVGTEQRVETSDDTMMDDVSNQGRMIAEMDQDADVVLEEAKDVAANIAIDVVEVVTTGKLIIEVVTAASITITAAEVPVPVATTAAASTLIAAPRRRTKGVVIRDPEESTTTTTSTIIHTEAKSKDNGKGILNVAGFKMDYFKGMSYDDIRPIFEAKFNINVAFLQMTKEHIKEKESKALKRLNETLAKKAAKRQKLDKEVEELKRHL
nr:hypothetical protein [Tanacetum cinerariifolium]